MLRERTVFGPIHSRRLGNSLGINLLPEDGKICSFDCIYCECGWNRDGIPSEGLPSASRVRECLERKLSEENLPPIDSITFSGSGEPTLHPEFPEIIDIVLEIRDRLCPKAKVSVLSNSTRAHVPSVMEALRKVDNPIMKLDAPTDSLSRLIDRPSPGYSVERTVSALKAFEGDFILQTMFLKSPDFDSSSPEVLLPWMDIVRILHPREVMAYTLDRPSPMPGLQKFSPQEIRQLVEPLIKEGFNIQIRG